MRTTVRATRTYMAGLGTSGSLVAGAALLFVLGSAIVAFRGWPQIATGPATTAVSAAAAPTAPSRVAKRLAVALRRPVAIAGAGVHRPGTLQRRGATRGKSIVSTAPVGSASAGTTAAATGSSGASNSGACGGSCGSQGLIMSLASTVSQQVTSIGSSVGSQVNSGSGIVAGGLSGVSPQAGGTVQSTGSTAGNAVSGTSTTAGSAVSQTGSALGGGH